MRKFDPVFALGQLGLYLSMLAIVSIMLVVTVDVILRNLFASSIPGGVEIAQFLQGIAVFLGLAATLRSGSHISADIVVERLPLRTQAAIDLATSVVALAVFGLMTYALWYLATGPGSAREISDLLGIPTRPFKIVAALGVALMCIELLRQAVVCWRTLSGPGGSADKEVRQ